MTNLNLEFSGNVLRLLLLNELKEIVLKEEINLGFNIYEELASKKSTEEIAAEFEESVQELVRDYVSESGSAGILIGTEQTFLSVTPVDFNEDNSSIVSHILWEISNYYPETYKDFNIKYYRLHNNFLNENIDDALLIAVNKKKLELIRNLCASIDLRIKNVEIDHFAVEKCLKDSNSEIMKNRNVLIIGCKHSRLDFSLISDELLRYYNYDLIEDSNYRNMLMRQVNSISMSFYNTNEIYLYGDESTGTVKKFLEEQFSSTKISYINFPEKSIEVRFAPLYGLALKNIE